MNTKSKEEMAELEEGLRLALEAAGGKQALANKLGIALSSLMEWRWIPSHRILQVEAVTGIKREKLRPDLYRER